MTSDTVTVVLDTDRLRLRWLTVADAPFTLELLNEPAYLRHIGDKGVRVKTEDGRDWRFPNHGALLRAEPDGSHFEVYARGLRNIQEIAFDAHGNIFGVDNDADKPGEMERFVYIANHIDADMPVADENVATLEERLDAPLLGRVPWLEDPGLAHIYLQLP